MADGTVLDGLRLNGNNFVSGEEIDPLIFSDNCSPVTISDGENEEIHPYMDLVQCMKMGEEWWFVLRDLTEEELDRMKTQSDIAYLAMMTGVDL